MNKAKPDTEMDVFLMQRTGEGDRGSFEQLYERYAGVLFTTALNVLGNPHAAEDVLQDVFVAIWEKAPLYDSVRGRPLTWAVSLARYKAIDRLRSLQRKGALHERAEQEARILDEVSDKSSLEDVEASEQGQMVRDAVLRLSPNQREAITMAYFDGLTQTEIARKLGEPLGTVKARIRRGLMRLKEIVAPRM